jgi:hypothetical protein
MSAAQRERLAGRTAGDEVRALAEVGVVERSHVGFVQGPIYYRLYPVPLILSNGVAGVTILLHHDLMREPRVRDTHRQSPGSGEELD